MKTDKRLRLCDAIKHDIYNDTSPGLKYQQYGFTKKYQLVGFLPDEVQKLFNLSHHMGG